MKKHRRVGTGLTAGAFFLIGTLAVAQTPQKSKTTNPHGATASQPAGMAVDHTGGNGVRRAAGATTPQSTEATQRRSVTIVMTNDAQSPKARSSAHATESLSPANSAKQGENPLYEDHGKSGTNPLYEGREKSTANTHFYEGDPDRPVNIKQEVGPSQMQRKHIAGVKYEDRTAGNNGNANGSNAQGMAVNEQGSSQANLKPGAGVSAVQYKDPEDMTTRYRPGNNKTTGSAATQGAGAAQQKRP